MTTLLIAACSSGGGATTVPSSSAAPSSAAPQSSAAPSSAAPSSAAPSSAAPSGSAAASDEYEIKTATATGITGSFLTGEDGKTLYLFKKDTQGDGKSTCNGDCAATWPAFTLDAGEQATAGEGVTGSKTP